MRRCVNELGFVETLSWKPAVGYFLMTSGSIRCWPQPRRLTCPSTSTRNSRQPRCRRPITRGIGRERRISCLGTRFRLARRGWHPRSAAHFCPGALDRHPSLKLLSGHWGEFVAGWLDRLDEAIGWGTHLDRTVSEYYREHVWATPSGMYSQNQLQFILAEIGAERIIYSEDFPYIIRDNVSDFLEQAELTDDQRTAIAHRNAENVMRIKAT